MYKMTKTYGNDRGFSCCFRQWRAIHSHCSLLHGYSLGFKFTIVSENLNECNWVFDFGSFTPVKQFLGKWFDHTLVIAEDDPDRQVLEMLASKHVANVKIMEHVGCEKFAEFVFNKTKEMIESSENDVHLESVEVFEHGANSAIYQPKRD